MNGKCVGRALGWTGGEIKHCDEPVKIGDRFCYRCHLLAIDQAGRRLESLRQQVLFVEQELAMLIHTCRETEQ
jgi:hypothetical protein